MPCTLHSSVNADLDIQHIFSYFHGRSSSGKSSIFAWSICTLYKPLNRLQSCTCSAFKAHSALTKDLFAVTYHNNLTINFQLLPNY